MEHGFVGKIRPCFRRRMESGEMGHQMRLALELEAYWTGYNTPEAMLELFKENYTSNSNFHPLVVTNWDNTARVGKAGLVLKNALPEYFRMHVQKVLKTVKNTLIERRIIFIKSWNEWAEGNHLEFF